jgi:hypothetical protein
MPSDYISKSALKEKFREKFIPSDTINIGYVYDLISIAPTLDLVPAPVACGECKFRCDFMDGHSECRRWPNVPMSYQRVDQNHDFCSYGERKDDNAK